MVRLGGDEFVVLQCDMADKKDVARLTERLAALLTQPFQIGEHTITISASIGAAVSDESGFDVDRLLAEADAMLYKMNR